MRTTFLALLTALAACTELPPVIKTTLTGAPHSGVYPLTLTVQGSVFMKAQDYATAAAQGFSEEAGCLLTADPVTATQVAAQGKPEKEGEEPKQVKTTEIKTTLRCAGAS